MPILPKSHARMLVWHAAAASGCGAKICPAQKFSQKFLCCTNLGAKDPFAPLRANLSTVLPAWGDRTPVRRAGMHEKRSSARYEE